MKNKINISSILLVFTLFLTNCQQSLQTDTEKKWTSLFDGKSTNGWTLYNGNKINGGWVVENETLFRKSKAGDIITSKEYGDFELSLEWKIVKNGNSGIMYRVKTHLKHAFFTGAEMQVLDNNGKNSVVTAGANYALYAPPRDLTKPIGEWNHARIIAKGNHIEHWLNGVQTCSFEIGSTDWIKRLNKSKFGDKKKYPEYAKYKKGYICLQDHGNQVWYKNIKIREFD